MKYKKFLFLIIIVFALAIPLIISLRSVLTGNIPFWYDNARDMLSAWDNLSKPTLIGPTSGIPGIFYGPYWIWLLSIGVFISRDPRSAAFVVGILPYFIIFPIILFRFTKLFGRSSTVLVWLLFIFSTGISYVTNMWNPNLAPLLFLILTYLLVFTDFTNKKSSYLRLLLTGIITTLIINFHISFGIGVFLGVCLFFLIDFALKILKNKANWKRVSFNYLTMILFFALGVVIAFLPFILFESRHGFNQTKTAINAFTKYGAVVHLKGLNKQEILHSFFSRTGDLLHIQGFWIYLVEILAVGWLIFLWKTNRIQFKKNEKRLVAVLVAVSIGVLFIYLTAKNPVWSYHFIATEIIFLLLIALIVSKVLTFRYLLTAWILFIVISSFISFTKSFNANPYASSRLFTKEYIVDVIARDAGNKFYTVFDYSPSIYQYDYTYLFRWRYKKDVPYDPGSIPTDSPLTYIILPTVNEGTKQSYINFRTPNLKYQTTRTWNIPDGTTILKREKK